ncbi:MAG: hypothetical protein IPK21_20270 [Haliscomenobacter sp.]|nr:hypothetical protein [Haliscomenobacter sp.]
MKSTGFAFSAAANPEACTPLLTEEWVVEQWLLGRKLRQNKRQMVRTLPGIHPTGGHGC